MRIAYFCCHPDHLKLGALSVASAKRHMPGVEIVHLTDEVTAPLLGADTVLRFDTAGNFWRRSWSAAAAIEGDVLHLGTDTIFRRDVRDVFRLEFQVALPHIAGPWRYDAGMVFARKPAFFRGMLGREVAALSEEDLYRDGVGLFLAEYHRYVAEYAPGVLELPGAIYEYAPLAADDPGIDKAAIVHYRGPRKRWMLPGWNDGLR